MLPPFPETTFEEPEKKCENCKWFNNYGVCLREKPFKFNQDKNDCREHWQEYHEPKEA